MLLEEALLSDPEARAQLRRIELAFGGREDAIKEAIALVDFVIQKRSEGYAYLLLADAEKEVIAEVILSY